VPRGRDGDRVNRYVRAVLRPVYRLFTPMRVEGAEHLPAHGAVIVAANHLSFYDTIVLMLSVPRRTFFLGKAEYLDSWTTRRLFPALGLIPIERQAVRSAMAALDVAATVLADGHVLGIYPEGTRSRDGLLHNGHTGVAQLALATGTPVVPVGLVGTDRIQPVGARAPRPFRHGVIRFGPPIEPAGYDGTSRRQRRQLTSDLMDAIGQLSGQATADADADHQP
jgi:1-acyl-sn-glycerol-3-phosphate acyltransferase